MKKTAALFTLILFSFNLHSQEWFELMQQQGKSFYEVQSAANEYFKDKDLSTPSIGYKQFKRWENYMEPRVYPSGDMSLPSKNLDYFLDFLKENQFGGKSSSNSASTTYTAMGPMGPLSGLATNGFPRKAGRDNFITFHPSTPTTFWAGAPAGGLWKTTDGGLTWTTNTDYLTVTGCSDLAVDPTNPNIMYLATGDGDAGDTYCIGVLKSTDGGLTWNATGLSFTVNQTRQMRRLVINPVNPQILLAATNVGLYRTTNGGTSWTTVLTGNWFDIEFKPGDPNTVYAGSNTSFRVSTDGGATFTAISSGITTSGTNRMAIAVTPADQNYVYVLTSNSSSNFGGLYRSVNSGTSFSVMSTSPNVIGNACTGNSTGTGQGWYDLAIAVSPNNKDRVDVGGVNVWSSNNGGATGTWTCTGCWIGTTAPSVYLKADHHDLEYDSNGSLFAATDGGIFRYNTSSWIDLNNQRNIAQVYKIGCSGLTANKWVSGHQDNGTGIYTNGVYQASYAGDGMDCFIDRTNDNNIFVSNPNGSFSRSTNGGASYVSATSGMTGTGAWVSPWKQDPVLASRLYAGRSQMFVSNNLGATWTQAGTTGGSGSIVEFAIAPSNNQVIYIIQGTSIRKTTNAGSTWSACTNVSTSAPTFITIDPSNENHLWVTVSGYSAGNKIFESTNAGSTWTNLSYNLPNLPANCSIYQPGSNDRLYVGMDVGVYTKDATSNTWTLYNTGLPNTPVSDFEISPAAPGLLRVATYGRGIYQVDLIQPTVAPTSNFVPAAVICEGTPATFNDSSTESPTGWNWSVSPSSGVTLNTTNSQNPQITFSGSGVYTVSLIASNGFGVGTTASKTVQVNPKPSLVLTSSGASSTVCVDEEVVLSASGASSYTWMPGATIASSINLTVSFSTTTSYTVTGKSSEGCTNNETIALSVSECTGIKDVKISEHTFEIFPNPADQFVKVKMKDVYELTTEIKLTDASGKLIQTSKFKFNKEEREITLDVSAYSKGIYFIEIKTSNSDSQKFKFVIE